MRQGAGKCVWTVRTTSQEGREGKNTGCVLSRLCNYEASEVDELDRQCLTWGLWLKPTWRRAYLVSISWVRVHWGKSRQESEGRNWSSSHGGALFTELFLLACSAGFYITQDCLPSQHNPQWAGIPRLTNQDLVPQANPQGPLSQSSFRVSSDSSSLQVDKRLGRRGGNQWHSPSTEEPGSRRITLRIFTDQQCYTCIYRRKVCSFRETLSKNNKQKPVLVSLKNVRQSD